MKNSIKVLFSMMLVIFGLAVQAQTALNMTQIGHLSYSQSLSEVRGCLHNGREYALVGANNGFSIVDVNDPANPTEVFYEPGPNSIWRDPFYHDGYAYCVTEGGGGLLIVDMSPLPGSTNLPTTLYTGSTYVWGAAHNMFIDKESDKAYIFGSDNADGNDGAIILDISNPTSPVELGVWSTHYIHDGFVRGDTLWASCLEEGTFVVDVSTPSNPVALTSWDTPSEFGHNVWPSDDNAFCYTTDEVNSGFLAAYDMSNFSNIVEVDKVRHPLSEGVIPHNTHFMNDYIVTSHYRDGVTIHDVSDPSNIVLTGYFDSSPLSGSGFNGAWGAWPYLPSGRVLVSDIEEGLFVLGPTYVRGARLEGTVTELGSGNPLNDVLVEISSASLSENTNLFGDYATGTAVAGSYDVTFQKVGYITQTITGVTLVNGQTEILDVELVPDIAFVMSGFVTEEGTGNPIAGASVRIESELFNTELITNVDGRYVDSTFYGGQYDVTVGAWGYVGECASVVISPSGASPDFDLAVGYSDDFALDLGWSVSGNASAGIWERGVPVATDFNGTASNPGNDSGGSCGESAYVTGNGGGSAGSDDVDDGVTILETPLMDLSNYTEPSIHFDYWFFNAGGGSNPNDQFTVKVDNGTDVVTIASLPLTGSEWLGYSFDVASVISVTGTMQLIIEVDDSEPGHLVEGGLDNFLVTEGTGVEESEVNAQVSIYPNPAIGFAYAKIDPSINSAFIKIVDMSGRTVADQQKLTSGINMIQVPNDAGVYLCEFNLDGAPQVQRLVIQ